MRMTRRKRRRKMRRELTSVHSQVDLQRHIYSNVFFKCHKGFKHYKVEKPRQDHNLRPSASESLPPISHTHTQSQTSIHLQSDSSLLPEMEWTESQEEFVEAPEALWASSPGRQQNVFSLINPLSALHGGRRFQHRLHLTACRAETS